MEKKKLFFQVRHLAIKDITALKVISEFSASVEKLYFLIIY